MVDTCAAEFQAQTPYFYATYDEHCDARNFPGPAGTPSSSWGPAPFGSARALNLITAPSTVSRPLKELGYDVVIINNNPETVSTDYDTADRLYFEPLTPEDVMGGH